MKMVKRILKAVGLLILLVLAVGGAWVGCQVRAFNASMAKVYEVAPPAIARSSDPMVIARGKHLVESMGACASKDCHGADFGGGKALELGPLGKVYPPNITEKGRGGEYSDGELARLLLHGIKRDGRTIWMMPAQDYAWWPDDDVQAVISYLRTVPPVERATPPSEIGTLAKVLDRMDAIPFDVARRIDHVNRPKAPRPEPTAAYGQFIGNACRGCHGETLSGGKIPGAPPNIPIPLNITPDETGIKDYGYDDFDKLLTTGMRKNGKQLDPFMPVTELGKMNDVEKRALWEYLRSIPPKKFGGR